MVTLAEFNIVNNYYNIYINWEFSEDSVIPSGSTINVYRSLTPGNNSLEEYDIIASGISIVGPYIDTTITNLSFFEWYYKITLSDGTVLTPTPAYVKSDPKDYVIKQVISRKQLVLNKFIGRPFKLLKRIKWGEHCPKCWDGTLFRGVLSDCPICHGTGWVGGYYKPIPFLGQKNPSPKYNQITMFGEWRPSDALLTMLCYPLLSVQDIIIDDTKKRWLVAQVKLIEKQGYVIEQQAQLQGIPLDEAIYSLQDE